MTASVSETLAAVSTLNRDDQPFGYAVEGQQIVGRWDIVRATSLYPTEVEHLDKEYAITVSFDEAAGTYDYVDTEQAHHGSAGRSGLSWSTSTFKGKETKKEFSFEFGGVNKTKDGVSANPVVYSFETSKIKDPLFAFLGRHGWKPVKHGFLARLFGR